MKSVLNIFIYIILIMICSNNVVVSDNIAGKGIFCSKEKNSTCNTIGFYFKNSSFAEVFEYGMSDNCPYEFFIGNVNKMDCGCGPYYFKKDPILYDLYDYSIKLNIKKPKPYDTDYYSLNRENLILSYEGWHRRAYYGENYDLLKFSLKMQNKTQEQHEKEQDEFYSQQYPDLICEVFNSRRELIKKGDILFQDIIKPKMDKIEKERNERKKKNKI